MGFPECILKDDLWKLFRPFGDIDSISIVRNCMKQPIAFIDMKNSSDAQRAIRDLDKQFFLGRNITVRESQQKFYEERFIYALLSFDKRECYIGETCDTIKRFRQHLNGKGDKSTSSWILTLKDSKPKPIILEIVQPGYDAHFQANFLETVWRLVASICCWEVINFPFLSDIREELKAAVTPEELVNGCKFSTRYPKSRCLKNNAPRGALTNSAFATQREYRELSLFPSREWVSIHNSEEHLLWNLR